jgi:hypothetical protein
MEKRTNARRKLRPKLVVVKGVENNYPDKKKSIHWAETDIFHSSMQILDDFVRN